jgi:hypothetical protein
MCKANPDSEVKHQRDQDVARSTLAVDACDEPTAVANAERINVLILFG